MRRPFVLAGLVLVVLAGTPTALASVPARMTTVEVPASGIPSGKSQRFTLVGLHWQGPGRVLLRTRSLAGRWTPWRPAAPEAEDRPDPGSWEARLRVGWRIGNPWSVRPSDRVQVRRIGRVRRVRAYLVWSPEVRVPYRVPAATTAPAIVPRLSWGADESIRRNPPSFAPSVGFSVVHHTAGRNGYTREEAAAIVKAIQLFHVRGNGWSDIGYNFLVDRFGTIYEGRYGGVTKNVVGAHALGFNSGSVGIALLGTYGSTAPSRAAQEALAKLIAWRLDLAHADPLARLTVVSGGSERYLAKMPVTLRAVSGHRDTGLTECPGDLLYSRLDEIAGAASQLGLPKIYEPRVEPSGETMVRFRARLSGPLAWTVSVTDAAKTEVARGAGSGRTVDWTWEAGDVPAGTYSWAIRAGGARPAAGSLRAGLDSAALTLEDVAAAPDAVTPNGDGQADTTALTFTLGAAANVTVEVADLNGVLFATPIDRVWTRAGTHTVTVDPSMLPDGRYTIVVRAHTAALAEIVATAPLVVSRTLGLVEVGQSVFSPNADGRNDYLVLGFMLAAPADVKVRVLREGRWAATPLQGSFGAGPQRVRWDGRKRLGRIRDGEYSAVVEATDPTGTVMFAVPFTSDTAAPSVRILPGKRLRVAVSEPAVLKLYINGQRLRREVKRAGTVLIRWPEPVVRARVVALDAAGNTSAPAIRRRAVLEP